MADLQGSDGVLMCARDRSVVITRSFTVQNAPNLPAQYSGKPFRPQVIVVKLQDGQLSRVGVSGQRVLAHERLDPTIARKDWWSLADLEKDAPAWVQQCVATVLRMESKEGR